MVRIEQLAEAALSGNALLLRSLTQDWLGENLRLSEAPEPTTADPTILSIAAGLVELLAQRQHQPPPPWTIKIGAAPHPIHFLKAAQTMRRLRELCETQSPLPLRKRSLFAPPTFLEFA
ncbi:MAG TPA: hypothetical protein VFE58_16795 [Tepidisphaeraceae bacterium]|jgi:hypothetical protein|nr:hypothetical protein [Tepidisphaeraceae bacterium]